FWTERRYESIALLNGVSVRQIVAARRASALVPRWFLKQETARLVAFLAGCAVGRWDIRFATGEKPVPELRDPFAALPVCPPGMLQNEQGLSLTEDDVRRLQAAGQWHYPLDFPWDGI